MKTVIILVTLIYSGSGWAPSPIFPPKTFSDHHQCQRAEEQREFSDSFVPLVAYCTKELKK